MGATDHLSTTYTLHPQLLPPPDLFKQPSIALYISMHSTSRMAGVNIEIAQDAAPKFLRLFANQDS